MGDLKGRIAFVTGASRGIGEAIARRLAAEGATVIAGARKKNAQAIAKEISASGGIAESVTIDVTDESSITAATQLVLDRFGCVDILVNNAGIVRDQLLMRMKSDEWNVVMATNLTAAFICTKGVLRSMVKQRWGRVINIGSVVGQIGNAGQANYSASKAGLIGFTKSLAREVASRGVTANVVAPGPIATDMTAELDDRARDVLLSHVPLGRLGTPEDVAGVVWFLSLEEASYITGQVIGVNGGMHM